MPNDELEDLLSRKGRPKSPEETPENSTSPPPEANTPPPGKPPALEVSRGPSPVDPGTAARAPSSSVPPWASPRAAVSYADTPKRSLAQEFAAKWTQASRPAGDTSTSPPDVRQTLRRQEQILQRDPSNVRIWYARGLLLSDLDRHSEALVCFDRVTALEPNFRGVWTARAYLLRRLGREGEAAESMRRALLNVAKVLSPEQHQNIAGTDAVARQLAAWRADGFDVKPLERILERDPAKAVRLSLTFAQNVEKIRQMRAPVERLAAAGRDVSWALDAMGRPFDFIAYESEVRELARESEALGAAAPRTEMSPTAPAVPVASHPPPSPVPWAIPSPSGPDPLPSPSLALPTRHPTPPGAAEGVATTQVSSQSEPAPTLPSLQDERRPGTQASPPQRTSPPRPTAKKSGGPSSSRGQTNGLMGRTNGLRGRVNGTRGQTNGVRGRTNGTRGQTNGLRGRTNGLTNGRRGQTNDGRRGQTNDLGKTNGLTNGHRGQTNGLGKTNGLTNGRRGQTNGLGKTNGLTNGRRGQTNGLTNGSRRTAGVTNGLVNGLQSARSGMTNGITNGLGMTNGLGALRHAQESRAAKWKVYLVPLFSLALLLAPLLSGGESITVRHVITVDGSLSEWSALSATRATLSPSTAVSPNVDVTEAGFVAGTDYWGGYLRVRGTALSGDGVFTEDALRVFIDSDSDALTGYEIESGFGADHLVEVRGLNQTIDTARLFTFDAATGRSDWNGWGSAGDIPAALLGGIVEYEIPRHWIDAGSTPRMTVRTQGWDGRADGSPNLGLGPRVTVTQESVAPRVAIPGTRENYLRVTLEAFEGPVQIDRLFVTVEGTADPVDLVIPPTLAGVAGLLTNGRLLFDAPIQLTPGSPANLTLSAGTGPGADGRTLGFSLQSPSDILVDRGVVTLETVPARGLAHVQAVPPGARIDGGFEDWLPENATRSDAAVKGNADIDLVSTAFQVQSTEVFGYAEVAGRLFAGQPIPLAPVERPVTASAPDGDRDSVPDYIDPRPWDFNNDGTEDAKTLGDVDGDGVVDYPAGPDQYLETTLPLTFPAAYAGRPVRVFIGQVTPPPRTGEDTLRVFVDTDAIAAQGYLSGGLYADYLLQITGKNGRVRDAGLYRFPAGASPGDGNAWQRIGTVRHFLDVSRVEVAADLGITLNATTVSAHIEIQDVKGGADAASTLWPPGSPNYVIRGGPPTRPGTRGSTLIDAGANAATTTYNHQRKTVRAGDVSPDTACDASNSDGCWYDVYADQMEENAVNTAPGTETITTGSKISGTFATDINSQNGVYINYRETTDSNEAWLAYRSNTGTNTVLSPKTRTWGGSSWGSETEESQACVSGTTLLAERLAASPTTPNTWIVVDVCGDPTDNVPAGTLDAYVCTPSCTLTSDIGTLFWVNANPPFKYFDIAFEQSSGQALLVWSPNGNATQDIAYKTYTGSWSSIAYIDDTSTDSGETASSDRSYGDMQLAPQRGSDKIGLVSRDGTFNDENVWIWDGGAFGNFAVLTTDTDTSTRERVGIAWESQSGHLLAVGGSLNVGTINYREYTTSWSTVATVDCGGSANGNRFVRLVPDPVDDDMILGTSDSVRDLYTCYWDGSNFASKVTHETNLGDPEIRAWDFAWESTGSKGLLVYTTTTATELRRRTFTAPSTWSPNPPTAGTLTNVGSGTLKSVMLATNPFPRSADQLILGAFIDDTSDTADDLGSIKWDGSTFTATSAAFTTDMAMTGQTFIWDPYGLAYHATNDDNLLVKYDWSGIAAKGSHTLQVKGYRQDENIAVQVYDGAAWNTRLTISATTNTLYSYVLTSAEYASGSPSVRFIDAGGDGGMRSDVYLDYVSIRSVDTWDRIILERSSNTAGTSWGTPIILASGRSADSALLYGYDSAEPSLAIDSGGYLHVVWVSASATGDQSTLNRVRYVATTVTYPTQSEMASAANWGSVTTVDDSSLGYMPTVSTDSGNNPHIAWSGSKTSGTVYYKNKYGGTWRSTVSWTSTYTGLSVDVSPQNNYVSLTGLVKDTMRPLVAYRSNTGTSTTSSPKTRTWDDSWAAETELSTAGSSLRAVRMAYSTLSNERVIITVSSDGYADAYVCTPSCTVTNNIGQVASADPGAQQRADIAYEQNSGQALLVYTVVSTNTARDLAYKTWDGASWSAEQYIDDTTTSADNTYGQVSLVPRAGSDQIALVAGDSTDSDALAWIWDGSSFGSATEVTASGAGMTYRQVAAAWESSSGHLIAASLAPTANSNIIYKVYTGSWGSESTFDCGPSTSDNRFLVLSANPVSSANAIVAAITGASYTLTTCYWDGSTWASKTTHDSGLDTSSRREFDFAWEPTGSKGIMVWGTTPGSVTYRAFTAPNTWGTITSTTMGSDYKAWTELRTNPNAASGDVLVYGVVLEGNTFDLGAVTWDGTTFAVIGASTFTADVSSDSYETFDLDFHSTYTGVKFQACKSIASNNCDAASEFTRWDGAAGSDPLARDTARTSTSYYPATESRTAAVSCGGESPESLSSSNNAYQCLREGANGKPENIATWLNPITGTSTYYNGWDFNNGGCFSTIHFQCVNDGATPDDATSYVMTGTVSDKESHLMENLTIPSGFTDIDVTWEVRCLQESGGTGATISHIVLETDGTSEEDVGTAGEIDCTTTWTTFSIYKESSPGGGEWTAAEINAMECGYRGDDVSPRADITRVRCLVNVWYNTTNYQMDARYDWSGIPTDGDAYEVCVEAYVASGSGESMLLQVLTPSSTWNTRITVTKTSDDNADQCYTLTSSEFSSGAPAVKWISGTETSDSTRSDLNIDQLRIKKHYADAYPSLATTYESNGDLWVAYADNGAATRTIYARKLDYPSAGWQTAEQVDQTSSVLYTRPSIGINKNSDVRALYVDSTNSNLYYKERNSGTWGSRTLVSANGENPTIILRMPNDATYGTDMGGVYYKTTTTETYHYYVASVPEFADLALALVVAVFALLLVGRSRRRRRLGAPSFGRP